MKKVMGILLLLMGNLAAGLFQSSSASSVPSSSAFPPASASADVRLPYDVSVRRYAISLRPYLDETDGKKRFTFDGKLAADLVVNTPTNKVVFNAKNLNISKVSICNGECSVVTQWKLDQEKEFLIIPLNATIEAGEKMNLTVDYVGVLNDDLMGFYRSKYTNNGKTKYIATTQMEPTGARQAFPCLDEPDRKAIFAIEILCNKKYTAVSNMPLKNDFPSTSDNGSDIRIFRFEETVKMSTYLVAFIVHDFRATKAPRRKKLGRVPIAVWGRSKDLSFAAQTAAKVLSFYEKLFQIPFPLPKLDLAAIPDFDSGAMENWGLMTFRETALAYNPIRMSNSTKIWTAEVVSHELTHQWFGNLVTMKWWDDLWLNEAFAEFLEHKGLEHVLPDVPFSGHFQKSELHLAMRIDALVSSHAVSQEVKKPAEIDSLFDKITYQKGSSLLRMLSAFLGETTFQRGLRQYLNKYRYNNAIGENLWEELEKQARKENHEVEVGRVMTRWTKKEGYPVVQVTRAASGDGIKLTQSRFFLNGSLNGNKETWDLPITISSKEKPVSDVKDAEIHWMTSNESSIVLRSVNAKEWFLVNVEQAGVYRVNYDHSMWRKLLRPTTLKAIPPANRAQMIDDAMHLARAGLLKYEVALDVFVGILKADDNYYVWNAAFDAIKFINKRLSDSKRAKKTLHNLMDRIGAKLFEQIVEKNDDDWNTAQLRPIMYAYQCKAENKRCLKDVVEKARAWKVDRSSLSPNLRNTILCRALSMGKIKGLEQRILRIYKKEQTQDVAQDLRSALTCSKNKGFLKRLLNESLSNGIIRKQDAQSTIGLLGLNYNAKSLVWNHIRNNWDSMMKFLGSKSLGRLLETISDLIDDEKTYSELESLVRNVKLQGVATLSYKRAVESIALNIDWKKKNVKQITKLLRIKLRHLGAS